MKKYHVSCNNNVYPSLSKVISHFSAPYNINLYGIKYRFMGKSQEFQSSYIIGYISGEKIPPSIRQ